MTESTASAIISVIGSASPLQKRVFHPHFLSAARLRIVSCPPFTEARGLGLRPRVRPPPS